MEQTKLTPSGKPFDIHERLLLFACDIVRVTQFLHTRGPIARHLSYQILSAGTSVGSNAEEADGGSSHDDFIAKNRIALKEAKETRFPTPFAELWLKGGESVKHRVCVIEH